MSTSKTVFRTVISSSNPAKYYVGDEETIKVGGYSLTLNEYRFNIKDEEHPSYTGDIGEVEIITMGHLRPTRIASALTQINDKLPSLNRPQFRNNSHRILIRNFTRYNLYSVDRNGIKTLDKPQTMPVDYLNRQHSNSVVIREEYYYETSKAAMASLELMRASANVKGLVAIRMTKLLEESKNHCSLGCCLVVDYVISESKLLDLGIIYHTHTDRVLSFTNTPEMLEHPCSPDYVPAPLCNGPTGEKDVFATFRYVSRKPNAQTLYVRIAGQILKLRPCSASSELMFKNEHGNEDDYAYLDEYVLVNLQQTNPNTQSLAEPGKSAPAVVTYRPYAIPVNDGMEKFGIFRNEIDANKEFVDFSQKERKYEEKIDLLEIKLNRAKLDCEDIKRETIESNKKNSDRVDELIASIRKQAVLNKEELDRKDIIIEELKKSNHKETEELKEKREQTTHKTKTFHDYVKIFFAIVAGILALIPVYLKFRAANPLPLPI